VQSVLHDLHIVTEAILPHFNRYRGAQAIASSAALYICRPTRRSLPAAQALTVDPRIYTQGKSAEETASAVLPAKAVDTMKRFLAEQAPARVLLVGDGWPADMTSALETTSLRGYLRTLYTFQHGTHSPYAGVVAMNLFPHFFSFAAASLRKNLLLCPFLVIPSAFCYNTDKTGKGSGPAGFLLVARHEQEAA
jgi:N4-bis(aminopropyl)spermidine synthase